MVGGPRTGHSPGTVLLSSDRQCWCVSVQTSHGMSELRSPGVTSPHLAAVRTGAELRPVHTLTTFARESVARRCLCLFPMVISVPVAPRSPPWGPLPLLPVLVCCPISEPGPGLCAANSPPLASLPSLERLQACPGAELASGSLGGGDPTLPEHWGPALEGCVLRTSG